MSKNLRLNLLNLVFLILFILAMVTNIFCSFSIYLITGFYVLITNLKITIIIPTIISSSKKIYFINTPRMVITSAAKLAILDDDLANCLTTDISL